MHPNHESVAAILESVKGQLVTTGEVVGEVMYFLSEVRNGPVSFARLLIDSSVRIVDTGPPGNVLAAAELMARYSDTPMDFADATLVLVAGELDATNIFTLDRRGFSTFKTAKGKGFRLLPAPLP